MQQSLWGIVVATHGKGSSGDVDKLLTLIKIVRFGHIIVAGLQVGWLTLDSGGVYSLQAGAVEHAEEELR